METLAMPAINFAAIMPETILSIVAMALLLVNVFVPTEQKAYLGYLSLIGIVLAVVPVVTGWNAPAELQNGFNGSVLQDNFALFFKGIFLVSAALSILISDQYMQREGCNRGELYPLILLATAGMMLMASGTDMMVIFLGLEVLSVSLYVLAGFNRDNMKSNEAGLKYFLLGAFSTGFLLYGMALTFGATGTTKIARIGEFVAANPNITALYQQNIKRMLAYSSIAHAGYVLVGFVAGNAVGMAGIMFYMLSYAFMNIGAFAIIVMVGKKGEANNNVADYAGFGFKHPVLGLAMSIFLFSLAGVPPAAGFIGKFYLFSGAIQAGYVWLAIIGVLNSAVSVYYYLRIMVFMYMKDPVEEFDWLKVTPALAICVLVAVAGVLIPGIVPGFILEFAQKAVLF